MGRSGVFCHGLAVLLNRAPHFFPVIGSVGLVPFLMCARVAFKLSLSSFGRLFIFKCLMSSGLALFLHEHPLFNPHGSIQTIGLGAY